MEAAGIFCVVNSDSDNLVTVLLSRELRPDLPICARASGKQQMTRLKTAGADNVISPAIACGFDLTSKMLGQDRKKGYFEARTGSSPV